MPPALVLGYTVVVAAPAHMIARSARIHSYRVLDAIPTRCSGSMSSASRPAASVSTRSAVCRQVSETQSPLFDRLVFSKVREVFGGRIRLFISGAAPLNRDIGEWFHAAGLLILEGYGLTETAAGACINRPDHYKLGTVGLPFEGTSIRINDDDGEIQIRGACVMDGYHNLPDKTAETFTDDGWLRTGDVGTIDADGFLTVTGRIKEIFKTSGGKYIARRRSRRSSRRCVPMPASSWCSARPATSAWR